MFNTIDANISMVNEELYFDEGDKYSYGKWYVFTVKGILAPSND